MMKIFWPTVRLASLAMALGNGCVLPAAFVLQGELPATFAGLECTIARESLEARTSTQIASGAVLGGKLTLPINAPPGLFSVQIGKAKGSFVAGDGQILQLSATTDGSRLEITGSRDQELFTAYEAFRAESLARKVTPVREAKQASQRAHDEAALVRLNEVEITAYLEHRRELNDFTLANLRGSAALYASSLRWEGDHRLEELTAAVNEFSHQFPGSEIARLMEERIGRFRTTAIGAQAPDLAGPTPEGTTIRLSDFRGRYVLVDFWAAWCAPCRIENRHYAELYRRYRAAGFDIFAVSVDFTEKAWKDGIAADAAIWPQISDLKGWKSPLAGTYNVAALPASFLLDREGRIIAKDLRGKQLDEKLAALFPNVE